MKDRHEVSLPWVAQLFVCAFDGAINGLQIRAPTSNGIAVEVAYRQIMREEVPNLPDHIKITFGLLGDQPDSSCQLDPCGKSAHRLSQQIIDGVGIIHEVISKTLFKSAFEV